jgi:hypothetical protein
MKILASLGKTLFYGGLIVSYGMVGGAAYLFFRQK